MVVCVAVEEVEDVRNTPVDEEDGYDNDQAGRSLSSPRPWHGRRLWVAWARTYQVAAVQGGTRGIRETLGRRSLIKGKTGRHDLGVRERVLTALLLRLPLQRGGRRREANGAGGR